MESIRELFRIGTGPSSSHTMGPCKAAERFLQQQPNAARYQVTLFGSLAATGKGHLTDKILEKTFGSRDLTLIWKPEEELPLHPNALRFEALSAAGEIQGNWEVYSVGGGALQEPGGSDPSHAINYLPTMDLILEHCANSGESFWEYVEGCEGQEIWSFFEQVWQAMSASLERGLHAEGVLPGGLGLARKAHPFFRKASLYGPEFKQSGLLCAYAHAVSEENAAGGVIVTAPTCGASGVLPAVLRHLDEILNCGPENLLRALATAGLIGNLVKHNASISGAEVGCQGEVGTACAMAAAAATQLYGGTIRQIEYAAEMGLEHHLGLTCDPVKGLVQIPCIERNAHAAARALSCCHFALLSDGVHKISFTEIVAVMKETGQALPSLYRETSNGGIAQAYHQRTQSAAKRNRPN
ncbi:L-serine ammonia-lyase, iron-sulfur-dependent, subunit alpha [Geothermobacter hydrogeniphilus]|uniref:L-serine ammonia-lyase n=1 Tax=Geothermobacter hydrogeniphilus TaxID=1969733 RepID=A0A1X0XW71_9BACT|nr:L-serine ammonia-lyase, iron-sulfur-dependent, subunit alpha [Geothermobacter hydrogeniphilus]ORJ57137.1 serine dehydratase [Geothermobacter hydrogeniphilus]